MLAAILEFILHHAFSRGEQHSQEYGRGLTRCVHPADMAGAIAGCHVTSNHTCASIEHWTLWVQVKLLPVLSANCVWDWGLGC